MGCHYEHSQLATARVFKAISGTRMRHILFAAATAIAIGGTSSAARADGFLSTPVAEACCQTEWSGLYVAGSIGYGDARSGFTHHDFVGGQTSSSDLSSDGVTGTIAVGYDRQFQSNIVAGVFADYTFGELDSSGILAYTAPPGIEPFSLEYDNVWAVGARLGFARSCCTLWYVSAGYTEADLTFTGVGGTIDKTLSGYFLGAGVEQNIRDFMFLKLEYRFSDYGKDTLFNDPCCEGFETETEIHSIRLGIAYKFGRREAEPTPLK